MIEQSAKHVAACHMPLMEAELQTTATEMTGIRAHHVNDFEASAKTMMCGWIQSQSKVPSPEYLVAALARVGLSLPESSPNIPAAPALFPESAVADPVVLAYPKLSVKLDEAEKGLARSQADNDFLFMAAAAWVIQMKRAGQASEEAQRRTERSEQSES